MIEGTSRVNEGEIEVISHILEKCHCLTLSKNTATNGLMKTTKKSELLVL